MPHPVAVPIKIGYPSTAKELSTAGRSLFYRTKTVPPLAVSGDGIYIHTADGSTVIDAFGGACVIDAISTQVATLPFVYQWSFTSQPAEDLAEYLIAHSKGYFETVNFVSGGSEANESAIKLVLQYFFLRGETQRRNFIGRDMSFHGNTIGALSLGMHKERRLPYEGIVNHGTFHHVSPCLPKHNMLPVETEDEYSTRLAVELEEKILELGPDTVAAFFAEPMVGAAAGCTKPVKGYFPKIREVCDKYGVLLVFDEIMCGMWRLGTMFAFETLGEGVSPDIMTCGKGLGAGYVSVGAMFVNKRVMQGIREGTGLSAGLWFSGHTYVGHPVTCAGALAVQRAIQEDGLAARITPLGKLLEKIIRTRLLESNSPAREAILDIRGQGLFWAVEYKSSCQRDGELPFSEKVKKISMSKGVVVSNAPDTVAKHVGDVNMIAPAFITTEVQMEVIANVFCDSVELAFVSSH
ncbi:pyridoxal phosphate-dependent transferase [Naematelia encephala]|uniref:Pyridoxal phosphate-dependent transferase n=1 Tax=Naematelia encephala TaxID=71784 RepID=A0A1Y2ARN5_9TREE|nr:pyridoxal phosphate-dependent transferase [Naematelia encephala]